MLPDLSAIFTRYEALAAEADALFLRVREMHPDCVVCEQGCSDCCHAMFDLSLVEAMYLNQKFAATIPFGKQRSDLLTRASETDRQLTRLKRQMFQDSKKGKSADAIMDAVAHLRMPCPLLEEGSCLLYAYRPVTCRLYGIPLNIHGKGHVCGKTGFSAGQSVPAVQMERIQDRLEGLSRDIAQAVNSRFDELHQVYVPVSMALLTRYDATYLGVRGGGSGTGKGED